jgi:hypothetical protein
MVIMNGVPSLRGSPFLLGLWVPNGYWNSFILTKCHLLKLNVSGCSTQPLVFCIHSMSSPFCNRPIWPDVCKSPYSSLFIFGIKFHPQNRINNSFLQPSASVLFWPSIENCLFAHPFFVKLRMTNKITIFWKVTPCSMVATCLTAFRKFISSRIVRHTRTFWWIFVKVSKFTLSGSNSDAKDKGATIFRNVCNYMAVDTA